MNKKKLSLLINTIIVIDVLFVSITGVLFGAGEGQLGIGIIGLGYFKTFTMDSNIFAGITSLLMIIYTLKGKAMPRWTAILKFMSTTSLFLTMVTVIFFLSPLVQFLGRSYFLLFKDDMFFFHFLNPVLTILSFILFDEKTQYTSKTALLGVVPVFLYSIVYFTMVVVLGKWNDFYHFSFGGKYELAPIVLAIIYSVCYGLARCLIHFQNKRN